MPTMIHFEVNDPGVQEIFMVNDRVVQTIERIVVAFVNYRETQDRSKIDSARKILIKNQLTAFMQRRQALILDEVARRLGKKTKEVSSFPGNYQFEADSFNSALHPYGEVMDAALKAAYGMTAGVKPEVTLDGRLWREVTGFEISFSQEQITVSPEDLTLSFKSLAEAVAGSPDGNVFKKMFKVRDEGASGACLEVINGLQSAIMRGQIEYGADARLTPGKIVITTEPFTNDLRTVNSARHVASNEDKAAESIAQAVEARVKARLKGFGWDNAGSVKVNILKNNLIF